MKIGIITLPLSRNYGGILQNYALQTKLIEMGHEPITIDIGKYDWMDYFIEFLKYIIKCILKRKTSRPPMPPVEYQKCELALRRFVAKNIRVTTVRTRKIYPSVIKKYDFQTLIVGSDQVWRPRYTANIYNMYLNFAKGHKVKKIAYAASFGVGKWEYTLLQTIRCRYLVSKFDAVSVREDSAIYLCRKNLRVSAEHVLDPTLLLTSEDYNKLIEGIAIQSPKLFAYFLDSSEKKITFMKKIADYFGLQIEFKSAGPKLGKSDSIEQWLANFRDATFIITDSFHGCVFSIIYNKPFLAVSNPSRGHDRMASLLSLIDLDDRIFAEDSLDVATYEKRIEWDNVNTRLEELRQKSLKYLQTQLGCN